MKKINRFARLLLLGLALVLAGCAGAGSGGNDLSTSDVQNAGQDAGQYAEQTTGQTDSEDAPVVYFSADISASGLVRVYEQLGWEPAGKVAVKISTGEPPASNYLRPELIGELAKRWTEPSSSATQPTADPGQAPQCINRSRRTTDF